MAVVLVIAVAGGVPLLICLSLALGGRRGAAWKTAGAITAVAVAIPVFLQLGDTHGQAGLAAVFLIMIILGPAVAGGLLGAGLGHLLTWRR